MNVVAIVNLLFNIFYVLILARIVISFIRISPYHPTWGPVIGFIYNVTEPLLAPIRRILPPMGGLDFSPMLVLILASVLKGLVIQTIVGR